jgi:hypothetical protein
MSLDYATLELLRQSHPAWRLLRSEHAPLVASFLQRVFIAPNVRVMTQADLAEALEDELYGLRERLGAAAFPKSALDYLNDWAANDKGWLRKYLRAGLGRTAFRPDAGYREGDRLAGDAGRTQLRRHRVAPADPVRVAQADERGQRERSAGAHRRIAAPPRRDRRRDRARPVR